MNTGGGTKPRNRYMAEDYTREATYAGTRRPVNLATTLLPEAYTAPGFYEIEQERVFAGSWVVVGCAAQVREPGNVLVASVAGQSLLVTRDQKHQLHAFYNVCRHRGTRLMAENGQVRVIRCPYHSWGYDLTGRCIGTPLFEGSDIPPEQRGMYDMSEVKAFDREDYGLLPVRVEAWECLVFVNLDGKAPPLREWLGDLPRRLGGYRLGEWELQRSRPYEMRANWKLVAENFMEYYHLPWVHPELIKVSRMEDHYRYQGAGMYCGMTTSPVSPDTEAGGWLALPPGPHVTDGDAISGRFIWIFPNAAISVLPNHLFMMIVAPEGPGLTIEQTFLLSHPGSTATPGAEAALDKLLGFWDLVNTQDIEIVEQVQQGLETARAYTGGRLCYHFEEPVHRFQNMVIDRMVGVWRVPAGDTAPTLPAYALPTSLKEAA